MKEDLERIIKYYGIRNQLKKFNEETYELIEAINDYERQKEACENIGCSRIHADFELEHMVEEIADCFNMLEQFIVHYNLDDDKITEKMRFKVHRQLERIKNSK
jgi:NTP pyrophosphatase (non-canonical NTP hydrolase)